MTTQNELNVATILEALKIKVNPGNGNRKPTMTRNDLPFTEDALAGIIEVKYSIQPHEAAALAKKTLNHKVTTSTAPRVISTALISSDKDEVLDPEDFVDSHWAKMDDKFASRWHWYQDPITKSAMYFYEYPQNVFTWINDHTDDHSIATTLSGAGQYHYENDRFVKQLKLVRSSILDTAKSSIPHKDVRMAQILVEFYSSVMHNSHWRVYLQKNKIEDSTGEIVWATTGVAINPISAMDKRRRPRLEYYLAELLKHLHVNKKSMSKMPVPYSTVKGEHTMKFVDLESVKNPNQPCETWLFFEKRFGEDGARVLRAWIWACLDSTNKGRQALYLYDKGGTGKSSFQEAVSDVIGENLVASVHKDTLSNQFGLGKLWDKRLILVPDNKNPSIIRGEKLHMILGGDRCDIELKGQQSFSHQFSSKVLMSGNIMPQIDPSATHERTRLIVLKAELSEEILRQIAVVKDGKVQYDEYKSPKFIGDPTFKTRLKAEFPGYLVHCEKTYRELCPTSAQIELPDSILRELYNIESTDEADLLRDFMDDNFVFESGAEMSMGEFHLLYRTTGAEKYKLTGGKRAHMEILEPLVAMRRVEILTSYTDPVTKVRKKNMILGLRPKPHGYAPDTSTPPITLPIDLTEEQGAF